MTVVLDPPGRPGRGSLGVSLMRVGTGKSALVVVNDPGGEPGTLKAARLAAALPKELLSTFTIIGMDRRGTGRSDGMACVPPSTRSRARRVRPRRDRAVEPRGRRGRGIAGMRARPRRQADGVRLVARGRRPRTPPRLPRHRPPQRDRRRRGLARHHHLRAALPEPHRPHRAGRRPGPDARPGRRPRVARRGGGGHVRGVRPRLPHPRLRARQAPRRRERTAHPAAHVRASAASTST